MKGLWIKLCSQFVTYFKGFETLKNSNENITIMIKKVLLDLEWKMGG
jgi:hypothetical protein